LILIQSRENLKKVNKNIYIMKVARIIWFHFPRKSTMFV
jgi:hypothetical protein